jgi:hypothetical protein
LTLEITENRVRYDVVEELTEISEIRVCFDAVLWKSVEIQARNHSKGVAFSVKTLMLTRHHSECAACLVEFKITINKIIAADEAVLDNAANEAIVANEADDSDDESLSICLISNLASKLCILLWLTVHYLSFL